MQMSDTYATAHLSIDLQSLKANYQAFERLCPRAMVAPAIKANAYGLGMVPVAKALMESGAKAFFTARLKEALDLRQALGDEVQIFVLDGLMAAPELYHDHGLSPVLNTMAQIKAYGAKGSLKGAALHLDTGMNRLGIEEEHWQALKKDYDLNALTLLMSHLSCADEPDHEMNRRQWAKFSEFSAELTCPKSLANSAGAHLGPDYHFDMIRPGIGLYGAGPFGEAIDTLEPVVGLRAQILQIRDVQTGQTIGYGQGFVAKKPMTIATVGIGYADGLLRSGSGRARFFIDGLPCPVVGRISMDVLALDIGAIMTSNGAKKGARCGDWVEILGPHHPIDEMAKAFGTIPHEVLTALKPRGVVEYL